MLQDYVLKVSVKKALDVEISSVAPVFFHNRYSFILGFIGYD